MADNKIGKCGRCIGMPISFRCDQRIFRRYTRNAEARLLRECQFADDGVLLASTREAMKKAGREYQDTSTKFGLQKTISMVAG